uniref:S100/CaBP-9k-type calcium binding subdomain domain-containing protein n=1 Tax=Scophthalmus maximus TaxID=52904 RepID=A0A8D3DZD0_SCOMX
GAEPLSNLELAINTLVTEFHKAADDAPTMNTTQFQTMISKQLPGFLLLASGVSDQGLTQVLDQMGVQGGENISFENLWTLINKQAVQLFKASHKENTNCGCLLQ